MNPFRKLHKYLYFTEAPEWRVISASYLIGAAAAGIGGFFAQPYWLAYLDAILAGWCLHGALSTRMTKVYRDIIEDTRADLRNMHELNSAMLEDRVRIHLADMGIDSGPAKTIN
jgi:hypothetical protein